MNISHNGNRGSDVNHIALLHQKLFRLGAYRLNDQICQQFFPIESLNALVQIDTSCPELVRGKKKKKIRLHETGKNNSILGRPGIAVEFL